MPALLLACYQAKDYIYKIWIIYPLVMADNDIIVIPAIKLSLSSYVREAVLLVGRGRDISDRDIHDARVSLKKARALLKLLRSQLHDDFYLREYETISKSGKALCALRESAVHRKLLKDIRKKHPDIFKKLSNPEIDRLVRKPEKDQGLPGESLKILDEVSASLKKSLYRIRFEAMGNLKQAVLLKELVTTWAVVRNAFLVCRNDPSAKKIHEFRKRAKDFLYQLAFFKPINPSRIRSVQKKTEEMTQDLGRHHDLAMLLKAIGYRYNPGNDPYFDELALIIKGEQDHAILRVWPAASVLFGPSAAFMDKLGIKVLIL